MAVAVQSDIRNLARFRYAIHRFLRFSDDAARDADLTPQHHQLLLGVAGFTGKGWATISDLADFLQVRHHSVVGLVDRAQALGLVRREVNSEDRREVHVFLTPEGARKLRALATLHSRELNRMRRSFNLIYLEGDSQRAKARAAKERRRG
jgi:DNA-binding MarR family transcriptional regulator